MNFLNTNFTCVYVSIGNEVPSKLMAVREIDGAGVAGHFGVFTVAQLRQLPNISYGNFLLQIWHLFFHLAQNQL